MQEEREVFSDEIKAKAIECKMEFFETSSKENTNVNEAFDKIIQKIYQNVYNKPQGIQINKDKTFSINKCCYY